MFRPVVQGVAVRKALPSIIKLAAISIATSVIAAAVVVFGLYGIHLEMVLHGYQPEQALIFTFCVSCMALIIFILWLRKTVDDFKRALLPKPTGVMGIVDSFMEGLKASDAELREKQKHQQ